MGLAGTTGSQYHDRFVQGFAVVYFQRFGRKRGAAWVGVASPPVSATSSSSSLLRAAPTETARASPSKS
eukprot:5886144-Lingulodinium_polyedra.AAC.1